MNNNNEDITKKQEFKTEKIQYLQMLQSTISRMSTASALFKGFSATIVAGISLITYKEINISVMALSFLPVLVFFILDVYYLQIERRMRYWYELVRTDKKDIDFRLGIKKDEIDDKEAEARIIDCIKSPSVYIFYPAMIIILAIVLGMKMRGFI